MNVLPSETGGLTALQAAVVRAGNLDNMELLLDDIITAPRKYYGKIAL